MGLSINLMVKQPVSVYSDNITHNLVEMASNVTLSNGMTLYDVIWRPDEQEGLKLAKDIGELLDEGWNILMSDPVHYQQWNSDNGWGTLEGLEKFVYEYRNACWSNPDAEVEVCR